MDLGQAGRTWQHVCCGSGIGASINIAALGPPLAAGSGLLMRLQGEALMSATVMAAGCAAEAEAGELAARGGQDWCRRRDCGCCCDCGCGGAVALQSAAAGTAWGEQGCCCWLAKGLT